MNEDERARIEAELPYGVWREKDGSEVLFNRHYCPMWRRAGDGSVTRVTTGPVNSYGAIWIDWVEQRFIYDTRSPPTHSKAVRQRCEAILAEWMSAHRIDAGEPGEAMVTVGIEPVPVSNVDTGVPMRSQATCDDEAVGTVVPMRGTDRYGVLVDFHAAREDAGAPAFWDGWYTERALAMEALRALKERHPNAFIHLVAQVKS